jgi:hypothetical protein
MNIEIFNEYVKDFFLEVEVTEQKSKEFETMYHERTGLFPTQGSGYQIQSNKWSTEFRVYFNTISGNLDGLSNCDVHIEKGGRPYKSNYIFRINNPDLFWLLVDNGYRLKENQVRKL